MLLLSKKELKGVAIDAIVEAVSVAHYELKKQGLTSEELELSQKYLREYASTMLRTIGADYIEH